MTLGGTGLMVAGDYEPAGKVRSREAPGRHRMQRFATWELRETCGGLGINFEGETNQ